MIKDNSIFSTCFWTTNYCYIFRQGSSDHPFWRNFTEYFTLLFRNYTPQKHLTVNEWILQLFSIILHYISSHMLNSRTLPLKKNQKYFLSTNHTTFTLDKHSPIRRVKYSICIILTKRSRHSAQILSNNIEKLLAIENLRRRVVFWIKKILCIVKV